VGDQNVVDQLNHQTNLLRTVTVVTVTVLIVFFIFLLIAWENFPPSINKSTTETPTAMIPTVTPSQTVLSLATWKVDIFDNINLNGSPLQGFTLPAEANDEGGYQISLTLEDLSQNISGMPANNYSLRLASIFELQAGYLEFHCEHHDGCRIYVDGRNWIDAWWDGSSGNDLARDISAGKHLVVIEFYDKSGYGLLEVHWTVKP